MLEQRPFPHDLYKAPQMSGQGHLIGAPIGQDAFKPVFGAIGTQAVRFFIGKSYNQAKSQLSGVETYDAEEMCEIQNDKFAKYTPRVRDLDNKQLMDLGALLQQFREQKDSKDTQIVGWMVITENERAFLINSGVYTVEQLAAFDPNQDSYRFGREGKTLIEKARQHIAGKSLDKAKEREDEYQLLLKEVSELRKAQKMREELYLEDQVARAMAESAPKRRRAQKSKTETDQTAA